MPHHGTTLKPLPPITSSLLDGQRRQIKATSANGNVLANACESEAPTHKRAELRLRTDAVCVLWGVIEAPARRRGDVAHRIPPAWAISGLLRAARMRRNTRCATWRHNFLNILDLILRFAAVLRPLRHRPAGSNRMRRAQTGREHRPRWSSPFFRRAQVTEELLRIRICRTLPAGTKFTPASRILNLPGICYSVDTGTHG